MPVALVVALILSLLGSSPHTTQPRTDRAFVEAWSDTAGPYGETWHLAIDLTGAAEVSYWPGPGATLRERRFRLSEGQRDAILTGVREAQFLDLPESLGPELVPLHGPTNVVEVTVEGSTRKVFLYEPKDASGRDVERFRQVWQAVVAASPIKPPI